MWEENIVEPFSEPMAMDTGEDQRLQAAVIPSLAQAEGSLDRIFMGARETGSSFAFQPFCPITSQRH
jgi:hypothetical protein